MCNGGWLAPCGHWNKVPRISGFKQLEHVVPSPGCPRVERPKSWKWYTPSKSWKWQSLGISSACYYWSSMFPVGRLSLSLYIYSVLPLDVSVCVQCPLFMRIMPSWWGPVSCPPPNWLCLQRRLHLDPLGGRWDRRFHLPRRGQCLPLSKLLRMGLVFISREPCSM